MNDLVPDQPVERVSGQVVGVDVFVRLLVLRYGTPALHEVDSVEKAKQLAAYMSDAGEAAPVAVYVGTDHVYRFEGVAKALPQGEVDRMLGLAS